MLGVAMQNQFIAPKAGRRDIETSACTQKMKKAKNRDGPKEMKKPKKWRMPQQNP